MTVKYFYKSLTLPERMDLIGTLFKAAQMGDANELRSLIDEDELILARSSLASTADTALHIATLAGKLNFVEELMTLKPELAERLNRDGFSPIHIASANGYTEIVRVLLRRGGEMMSHLRSGDGRTALHFAVITGSIDVVLELITAVPECKNDLTHEQESVFHLAVKNCQFEVFGQLVWKLKAQNQQELKVMLNARDCQGNTILHLATSRKLHRIVKVLLGEDDAIAIDKVDVNVKNKNNLTALDMSYVPENTISGAEANGKSIRSMLQHAGALRSQDIVIPQHANPTAKQKRKKQRHSQQIIKWVMKRRRLEVIKKRQKRPRVICSQFFPTLSSRSFLHFLIWSHELIMRLLQERKRRQVLRNLRW
ncbi:ankyrin repeat-containing protein BDA1 isoform X2 [Hevea brasiliensis]|uniref:ankyrin repeat-containing protein BDA1 isoform X2 n=1 Tax=Hevea brasiliensis TaxID=3981 RepID=UPI0025FF6EF6|nr:ankyrin repeat-containing protein BDA1 isoform X2 [Hevea brasiliensis]